MLQSGFSYIQIKNWWVACPLWIKSDQTTTTPSWWSTRVFEYSASTFNKLTVLYCLLFIYCKRYLHSFETHFSVALCLINRDQLRSRKDLCRVWALSVCNKTNLSSNRHEKLSSDDMIGHMHVQSRNSQSDLPCISYKMYIFNRSNLFFV